MPGNVLAGPSPRGRGRHLDLDHDPIAFGTIPAWAGATVTAPLTTISDRDHPRVGGGDHCAMLTLGKGPGPSPRGRGRLALGVARRIVAGTIPAWAGATDRCLLLACDLGDHPRVGGGDRLAELQKRAATGPSPRGRGRLYSSSAGLVAVGTIPAWAGATVFLDGNCLLHRDHPRVGGGDTYSSGVILRP